MSPFRTPTQDRRHTAMACLSSLPPEIHSAIAEAIAMPDDAGDIDLDLRSLAHMALVSRMWHGIANPLLYKHAILQDWYTLCPDRPWMAVYINPADFVAGGAMTFFHTSQAAMTSMDYQRLFGPTLPLQRVGVLMTAALAGDLALLSRLADYIPHILRPLDTALVLSASFYVPWQCLNKRHVGLEVDHHYATLLHAAAMRGDEKLACWLLKRGVAIDTSAYLDCLCPSPYMMAIEETGMWCAGESVDPTPLHLALAHGKETIAKLLIRKGAVWDRPHTGYGLTGLHMMAASRMTQMIEWIVDECQGLLRDTIARNGPVHDWPDKAGCWSLHYASLSEDFDQRSEDTTWRECRVLDMVSGLVRLGAMVNTTDRAQISQRVSEERQRVEQIPIPQWRFDNNVDHEWAQRIEDWDINEPLSMPEPEQLAQQHAGVAVATAMSAAGGMRRRMLMG